MPEHLMCSMRSDSKTVRFCQPDKCMWGRYYSHGGKRDWACSATAGDNYYDNTVDNESVGKEEQ